MLFFCAQNTLNTQWRRTFGINATKQHIRFSFSTVTLQTKQTELIDSILLKI